MTDKQKDDRQSVWHTLSAVAVRRKDAGKVLLIIIKRIPLIINTLKNKKQYVTSKNKRVGNH